MTLDRLRAFDAVVFDMDGVLLDSEPLHLLAMNRVIATEGHPAFSDEQNHRFVGNSLEATWTEVHRLLGLRHSLEHYYQVYDAEVLRALRQEALVPLDGVHELLAELRNLGQRVGLATQSHRGWVDATLQGLGLASSFASIASGEMVQRGKPAPDLYLLVCALLGADPRRSLAIEDSLPGVRAARAAGMTVVGVRNVYAGDRLEGEADLIVDRLDALLAPTTLWPSSPPVATLDDESRSPELAAGSGWAL